MLELLGVAYNELDESKLDKEFLNSDDFYILFKKTFDKMRFESREEKILMYKNFLVNSSLKSSNLAISKSYLFSKVDVIELEHFKIMKYYLDHGYTRVGSVGSEYDRRGKDLKEIIPNFEVYETDLENFGFLKIIQVSGGENRYMLNELGIAFLEFINYKEI
jgi:hypothetical protein